VEYVPEQIAEEVEPDSTFFEAEIEPEPTPAPVNSDSTNSPKRGRASIPSWDQIVFGTKTED
jgi:hypothetical protein